jgi:cytochrome c553
MSMALTAVVCASVSQVMAHGDHRGSKAAGHGEEKDRRADILLHSRCAMCHSTSLITQQRLNRQKWSAEVERMIKWGAPIANDDQRLLVEYLSRHYSPNSQNPAKPEEGMNRHHDSTPLPLGTPKNGQALYHAHCADCHGKKGEGHDGPPLAANPILIMDSIFSETVRQGRGGMPPWIDAFSAQEIADIQAWLKNLR